MSIGLAERLAMIDRVMADPPVVHYMNQEDEREKRATGVWNTEASCYRLLAERCTSSSRTLETGLGISTVLFAAWATEHRCITPVRQEAEALKDYCRQREIPIDRLTIDVGSSDVILPRLDARQPGLDIVLIDGGHGFPIPAIDWYYGAVHLRAGGLLVLDDVQLPAVRLVAEFLTQDPRWTALEWTAKWASYERHTEGELTEEWLAQPFYEYPLSVQLSDAERARAAARRVASSVKRIVQRKSRR